MLKVQHTNVILINFHLLRNNFISYETHIINLHVVSLVSIRGRNLQGN
jgi:hypothetical protein